MSKNRVSNKKHSFWGHVYGAVPKQSGTYTWGFPGSRSFVRPKTVPNWMVFWEDEPLFRNMRATTYYKDGRIEEEVKREQILKSETAAYLNYRPGKGKWVNIITPALPSPGLPWRKPTAFTRIESRVAMTKGRSVYTTTTPAGNVVNQLVTGYPSVNYDSDPLLKKYWHRSSNKPHALEQIARTRLMGKIRDADLDLSIALAEIRKTVDMIAKNALEVMAFYKHVRTGNFNAIWSKIKKPGVTRAEAKKKFLGLSASNRWLEYSYGWTPLVSDIKGLIDWANKDMPVTGVFRVTATALEEVTDSYKRTDPTNTHINSSIKGKRGCKIVVHYTIDDAARVFASQLGLNPLMTAWDLLPWSFVIDWFLTIGNALEYLDSSIGKSFISGSVTHFGSFTTDAFHDVYATWRVSQTRGYPLVVNPSHVQYKSFYCERTPLSNFPYPMPYVKNPLSTPHVVSAIALTRTNIRLRR